MAMLRVQDPIKVQKEYGHSAPSDRDSQQKQIFDQRFMRLVGRGLFCPVGRKSRECLPENVSVPKPTLVGRCSNCARHGASFKKTCCSLRAAAISRIEQGHQVPSLRTIEVLAQHMQIHPLTLVVAAYCPDLDDASVNELLKTVKTDFKSIVSN